MTHAARPRGEPGGPHRRLAHLLTAAPGAQNVVVQPGAATRPDGADELPPGGAGQLLAPWPNRIDGGRYVFDGTGFQLALTEPEHANAIHGLTRT